MTGSKPALTVVPDLPEPRTDAELEDRSKEEIVGYLRQMTSVSRQLCNAIDALLGPPRPARRPRLTVIRGGGDQ